MIFIALNQRQVHRARNRIRGMQNDWLYYYYAFASRGGCAYEKSYLFRGGCSRIVYYEDERERRVVGKTFA